MTRKLFHVTATSVVGRSGPRRFCVLAANKNAALRQLAPPGGKVEVRRDDPGAVYVTDAQGRFGVFEVEVRSGCGAIRPGGRRRRRR